MAVALPAAATTSSVGRGASAGDVLELRESMHTLADGQHVDLFMGASALVETP